MLETPNPIVDPVNPGKMNAFSKEISFNKVSFAYEEEIVIDKLNLTIPKDLPLRSLDHRVAVNLPLQIWFLDSMMSMKVVYP